MKIAYDKERRLELSESQHKPSQAAMELADDIVHLPEICYANLKNNEQDREKAKRAVQRLIDERVEGLVEGVKSMRHMANQGVVNYQEETAAEVYPETFDKIEKLLAEWERGE